MDTSHVVGTALDEIQHFYNTVYKGYLPVLGFTYICMRTHVSRYCSPSPPSPPVAMVTAGVSTICGRGSLFWTTIPWGRDEEGEMAGEKGVRTRQGGEIEHTLLWLSLSLLNNWSASSKAHITLSISEGLHITTDLRQLVQDTYLPRGWSQSLFLQCH